MGSILSRNEPAIRGERGHAIELLGQRDEDRIREVHRQVTGLPTRVSLEDASDLAAVDCFVATALTATPLGGAGANSMPTISERSTFASTFTPADPLRFFERSEPALAINSCESTLRSVKSNSG